MTGVLYHQFMMIIFKVGNYFHRAAAHLFTDSIFSLSSKRMYSSAR